MSEKQRDKNPNCTALVIAYAERIECFIKYLKKQPEGTAVTINAGDATPQDSYSIKMDVKLDGDSKSETVEIIYVKYQDNKRLGGLATSVDAEYAFIGGDLCDKEDVQDFIANCGVPKDHNHRFVTPCAYNIYAAGASGETDCQKREFKKSIMQKGINLVFGSEEKTPIAPGKNKFGYNVEFFNTIVKNSDTKQCVNRPFILLQFPLLICWSYKYCTGDSPSIPGTTQKLINMFGASSSVSNSLMESLRIPATHMFNDKPEPTALVEPVVEPTTLVDPNALAKPVVDPITFAVTGSNALPVAAGKQYKIQNITDEKFELSITNGGVETVKIFAKGRYYKNVGDIQDTNVYQLYSCTGHANAQQSFATFHIYYNNKSSQYPTVEEDMVIDDTETNFYIVLSNSAKKPTPIITNELLENLKQIKYRIDTTDDNNKFNLTIIRPDLEKDIRKEFKINNKYKTKTHNFIYELKSVSPNPEFDVTRGTQKLAGIVLKIDDDKHLNVLCSPQNGYDNFECHARIIEMLEKIPEPVAEPHVKPPDDPGVPRTDAGTTTIDNTAVNLPSAPSEKTYKIEKLNDTEIKLIVTQGADNTEKIFNRGETYKTTNSENLYKLGDISKTMATFKITKAGENDVMECIVFGDPDTTPVVTDIYKIPKDNPTITMDLLEKLEKVDLLSPPASTTIAEPTTTTTEDPKSVIKRLIETDPLTYQNIQDAIGVLNTMTLDGQQESNKNIVIMYNNQLETLEQNETRENGYDNLKRDIKMFLTQIVQPSVQPSVQPYKIDIPDDSKSFRITDKGSNPNKTNMFEVGKTYIYKNDPNTFSPYTNRSFKLESITQNDVNGASEKIITFGVGKSSEHRIYVDANGVPEMRDDFKISQILFFPALFNLTEVSEVASTFHSNFRFNPLSENKTFSQAKLGESSPKVAVEGNVAVEETKGESPPIENTDNNDKTAEFISNEENLGVSVSMFAGYCNSVVNYPDDGNKFDDFYILNKLSENQRDFKIFNDIAKSGNAQNQLDILSIHVFHKVEQTPNNGFKLTSVQPSTDPRAKKDEIEILMKNCYKYNELYCFKLKTVSANEITFEILDSVEPNALIQEYKINLKDGFMLEYNYKLLSRLYENNKNGSSAPPPEPVVPINFESVVSQQDNGESDLVGFGSKINNNNCYLNAMFQMLCRVKRLKTGLLTKLEAGQIAATKKSVTGGVHVKYNNPTYEIATIFKKYDDASSKSFTDKMATSVNVETEDVLGMKSFVSTQEDATKDTQHSIIEFLIKGVFCEDNDDDCAFEKTLYTTDAGFFASTLKFPDASVQYQLLEDSIDEGDKQRITEQTKDNIIFHFNRVGSLVTGENGEITISKIQTQLVAPNELKIGDLKYAKKGAIVHLGTGSGSGHYLYISYKTLPIGGQVVIDKIYNNENILVFNNGEGKPYLAKSQLNEGILEFFFNSIVAIINDVTVQQIDKKLEQQKNTFIANLTEAALEIIDSDILSLAQYNDVNNQLDVLRYQTMHNFGQVSLLSKQQIVNIFKYSQFNEILRKDINQIDEEVSQNVTYFLYELVAASLGGGASANKKKSWSRSRRAKKHNNVSLKRLNKMKQESHPSIKKRSTSLKK